MMDDGRQERKRPDVLKTIKQVGMQENRIVRSWKVRFGFSQKQSPDALL